MAARVSSDRFRLVAAGKGLGRFTRVKDNPVPGVQNLRGHGTAAS